MNKKILFGVLTIILLGAGYFLLENDNSENQNISLSASTTPDCVGVCASFDFNKYFENELNLGTEKVYTDPEIKNVIKFEYDSSSSYSQNQSWKIYVNDVLVGTTGGKAISKESFSPDHKHFGFVMRSTMGGAGGYQSHAAYVIDLTQHTLMYLLLKPGAETKNTKVFQDFETFVESYSWGVDNTILLTTYPVGMGKSGKYYRLTSKEVWSFDLTNPQSTMRNGVLVNTLLE